MSQKKTQRGFQVEVVVRKHPKPEPYVRHLKNGTVKLIKEITQEEMDKAVKYMAENHRIIPHNQ